MPFHVHLIGESRFKEAASATYVRLVKSWLKGEPHISLGHEKMSNFRLSLYCKTDSAYSAILPELSQLLESVRVKWDTEFKVVPGESLTADSERELKVALRNLPPQKRGEIVTSRGNMLPLSKGKKLNLDNTPILLGEKDGIPIDVFPKRTEDQYRDVRGGFLQMLEKGIEVEEVARSPEDLARSRLVTNLTAIEEGLELVGEEVPVQAGNIDILLKDKANQFLVVELKRGATDSAIGQVLRLSASLAQREGIAPASVRKLIVCARTNSHVELAASSVNIEIRRIPAVFLPREDSKTQS